MTTTVPQSQSLEDRILSLLAPFRPPFVYIQPSKTSASAEDQLTEQRQAKVLAQNIAFLIRDSEHGFQVTAEDVFLTTWGFKAWAEGTEGAVLALLIREGGTSRKILSVPVFPGESAVDKLCAEVEMDLGKAFAGLAKKTNGV